ncbi:MAG: hypothetical protein MAG451_02113 [Anaerolineales bacterium]|nr:hypothetical protein [Anaerolineales bacterium]
MNGSPFTSRRTQRALHVVVLLTFLLSPLQSIAAYAPPPAPPAPAEPGMPASTGLFRTTVTVRTPADWRRLEELGVVVLARRAAQGRAADQQKYTDNKVTQSAVF